MLPLRIVCPLAMFMILTSVASGQDVDDASFKNLAKQCQMRASVAASSRAIKIKDEAIAQHQAFNGSRVDRAGRIVFFWTLGSGERPGNRRQCFCESDPMASGVRILGKTQ
jgi:hypothetical protein